MMIANKTAPRPARSGRRKKQEAPIVSNALGPGMLGGRYHPLTDVELKKVHDTSLDILEQIGVAEPIQPWRDRVLAAGGWMTDDGRLCFPRALVEDTIAKTARNFTLYGRKEKYDMLLEGSRTYFAGSTAAIRMLDHETRTFREPNLKDLYDMVRLLDALDNVHFIQRPLIARDMVGEHALDLNTAYATTSATNKHITTTIFQPETLEAVVKLYDLSVGGDGSGSTYRKRPFASTTTTIAVSPLRYAADSCWTSDAAVRHGVPLKVSTAPQAGATGPASIAGTLALGNAEVLSGFVALNLLKPGCQLFYGNWSFISDLRTGAFVGGGGEMGLLASGCAQISRYYDLPSSIVAGMTSAKEPDAQAGWERGYLTALASQAGANMLTMTMGGLADNMAYSPEALLIDESMLSGVLRCLKGIEVNDQTLGIESIRHAVNGSGHFLDDEMTLEKMKSEFVYPEFADRQSVDSWLDAGSPDIRDRAQKKARRLLKEHYPMPVSPELDALIRDALPIALPREAMEP